MLYVPYFVRVKFSFLCPGSAVLRVRVGFVDAFLTQTVAVPQAEEEKYYYDKGGGYSTEILKPGSSAAQICGPSYESHHSEIDKQD